MGQIGQDNIKRKDIKKQNIILESEVNIMTNFVVQFPLKTEKYQDCLLYTTPRPRAVEQYRMPSSA